MSSTPAAEAVALDLLLAEAGPLSEMSRTASFTAEVEDCDGGQRMGVALLAVLQSDTSESVREIYAGRWESAGWAVTTGDGGSVSAVTPEGVALDLRTGGTRAGLAVRPPCTDPALLAPATPAADAVLQVETRALQLLGDILADGVGISSQTVVEGCGPGWERTVITLQGSAGDLTAVPQPDGAVRLGSHAVALVDPAGTITITLDEGTDAEGTLVVQAATVCRPISG